MRYPEYSKDGRKNHGFVVKYRPRHSVAWRICSVWAPTKDEAIAEVKRAKGVLARYIQCDNVESS